jgi:hypothetical protein
MPLSLAGAVPGSGKAHSNGRQAGRVGRRGPQDLLRRRLPVGGRMALTFAIDRWRGTTRLLVEHSDPTHSLNLDLRCLTCSGSSKLPRQGYEVAERGSPAVAISGG